MDKKINYFLIGVQKAGTSSFYNWISQHPQINAPAQMKDFHFFVHQKYMDKGTGWLESFYLHDIQKPVLLKGAVNYIYEELCAERIKNYNPESKFILILRDPVKRAFSAYQYFKKLGSEQRTFDEAIKDELDNNFNQFTSKYNFAYTTHGFYYNQISNWLKYFERNRFLILNYEDIFKSPVHALKKTFNFLGVEQNFSPHQLNTVNKTGVVKYKWINDSIFANKKLHSFSKNVLHLDKIIPMNKRILFLNWLRDWNTSSKKKPEKLNLEKYTELSLLYNNDREKLSDLLGIDYKSLWQY
jgi:hypothetical protein